MSEEKPLVLVVDDTQANLVAFEAILAEVECELVCVNNGNEALRQLLKQDFALMLLDVQMPEMDGYEVARYSRENPMTKDVPIIFVTAMHENESSMLRGYGTGAVDLLFKPINPHVLRSKVRVFLDLYMSRRRLSEEVEAHKKTLADLELANSALRHFTSAASHDLRAPLRRMSGFLEALAFETTDRLTPEAEHFLNRSRDASKRMDALLESLLVYARLQRPVAWIDVDCDALLAQISVDISDRIHAVGGSLSIGPLPKVHGDADRLYQLFFNLIGNATKFQREGEKPHIHVSAKEENGHNVFCVQDNGIGIPADRVKTIFEGFQRLHTDAEFEGSGLGLSICQQIIQQHGGHIWAESEEGVGSRFYFTLPKAGAAIG